MYQSNTVRFKIALNVAKNTTVTSVGESLIYVIASFDVRTWGGTKAHCSKGRTHEEKCYNLFIKENLSLIQEYPSAMTIKDVTIIKVK